MGRSWLCLVALVACGDNIEDETRLGGDTTTEDRSATGFMHPAANLTTAQQSTFQLGTSPFDFRWEIPQLGPLFNNDSCFGCHGNFGRGLSQIGDGGIIDINGPQSEALVRVSLPEGTAGDPGGPIPVPDYGLQLQDHATGGLPEVFVTLMWNEHMELFGDGELIALREPRLTIRDGNSDPLPSGMHTSYRIAPAIIGLGLLEAIDPDTLNALADPDDVDGDGISGRINMVWNPERGVTEIGRFGWKANTSRLHTQAAGAAANDMGLSSFVFPDPGNQRDVQDDQMEQMAFLVETVGVPRAAEADYTAYQGRRLFDKFGCSSCHIPTIVTGDHEITQLAHQTIHPFTDMLLHDMGDLLTDARQDFLADGREWRTPALWGIGMAHVIREDVGFLHDGRARTYAEAIMWHGGEAEAAREAFRNASQADRNALAAFLDTL